MALHSWMARVPRGSANRGLRSRRQRAGILVALLTSLVLLLAFGARSVLNSQLGLAGEPLPGLAAGIATAPRFLFSINGVSRPLGVAVSPSGDRIYATESDGARETKVFDRDGQSLGSLNPPGAETAARVPVYVAVSAVGEVYVSDRQTGTIHVYASDGAYLRTLAAPDGVEEQWAPLGLGFDGRGNLLVTNLSQGRHGVTVLNGEGKLLRQVGRRDEFSFPNGVAATPSGLLLVADSNNGRVVALDEGGNVVWAIKSGLALPRGLAVDERDRLYVADAINHSVLVFKVSAEQAQLQVTLGASGIKDGQFAFPNSVALDSTGRLYVADRENNRLQVWTY